MAHLTSLLVLAFAVSLDSFGVGITYGLRGIMIPKRSIMIIVICSICSIIIAMILGNMMNWLISSEMAEWMGGGILIAIGTWALYNIANTASTEQSKCGTDEAVFNLRKSVQSPVSTKPKEIVRYEIRPFGIVIQILRKPTVADIDKSGVISSLEALFLGIALSLDAFGAGIGAALLGYSAVLTSLLIALMCSLFLYMGLKMGEKLAHHSWITKVSYLPGVILILFGFLKIL